MQPLNQITLALIQAATEFLPISSSGHLALISNIISEPNLFFFTVLHLASLLAVIIFTRKEIYNLIIYINLPLTTMINFRNESLALVQEGVKACLMEKLLDGTSGSRICFEYWNIKKDEAWNDYQIELLK